MEANEFYKERNMKGNYCKHISTSSLRKAHQLTNIFTSRANHFRKGPTWVLQGFFVCYKIPTADARLHTLHKDLAKMLLKRPKPITQGGRGANYAKKRF